MTTCLGKSCSFGLLCVSCVNVYQCLYVSFFPFWFEGGVWVLTVLIPSLFTLDPLTLHGSLFIDFVIEISKLTV